MAHDSMESTHDELKQIVAHQAAELERLRRQRRGDRFADELREAMRLAATADIIAAPATHARLLELIVATAAEVIQARAASLFLLDVEHQDLVFEVALGQTAAEVKKLRVPLGAGVAGLVAVTGQPLSISDVSNDPRHAADIAEQVNYHPQSILCVPLLEGDELIGVLELLDKEGASSFGPSDMAVLSLFAEQAAVAIRQSQVERKLSGLLRNVLTAAVADSQEQRTLFQQRVEAFASGGEGGAEFQESLELARMVRELSHRGRGELRLCQAILRAVDEYLHARDQVSSPELTAW